MDARRDVTAPVKRRLQFLPSWRLSLFVAVFLPVVVSMSIWQWHRAGEAADVEAHVKQMEAASPRPLSEVASAGDLIDLQPVAMEGHFPPGPRIWLDNRTWRGRAGYELLAPFAAVGIEERVLVNLGWVVGDVDRSVLPEVHLPSTRVVVTGRLAPSRPKGAVFGPVLEQLGGDVRVQRLDPENLAEVLGSTLYPRVVVADPVAPGAQTWNFRPLRLTSARHRGYALQWLGLALVLVVGWCLASFRRTTEPTGDNEHADRT